mgnify:FL=1
MTDIQGKVFNDFIPPATTDGSYRGKKEQRDATQKHFRMKLKQELGTINQRLKQCKIKVKLLLTGNAIQLQATLPLKPGDTHKQGRSNKQYKISLGIPANFDGLRTAEEEAQELGKLIARQTFIWTDKYLGVRATKQKGITFREFYDIFELKYFANKKKTRKSIGTFENYKSRYKSIFMSDEVISAKSLREIVLSIYSPSPRYEAIRIASIISNLLSIDAKFTDLIIKQEKRERNIPSDKEIIFYINNFQKQYESAKNTPKSIRHKWRIYKLAYGLLAIYGLRPREIVNKPDFNWLLSSDNIRNTFKVHGDNKTGYREVVPFLPEWVDLFDIKNEENIRLFQETMLGCTTSRELHLKVGLISSNFVRSKIPFQPYDLRHACAIRSHLQGVPIKAASDNLGHTVEMHTKVYQHWFGFDNRVKAFNQAREEQNELQRAYDEITNLRNKVAKLELEITRLRLTSRIS